MRKRCFLLLAVTSILAGPAFAAARKIPGINDKDPYPKGCVDCHTGRGGMPVPLDADVKQWTTKVDPKLLARFQAFVPKGMTLKGKHPNVAAMVKSIPSGCLKCHAKGSKVAPPFATMIHGIHLLGGDTNTFMTTFQGECTFCHKLNDKSGEWTMP